MKPQEKGMPWAVAALHRAHLVSNGKKPQKSATVQGSQRAEMMRISKQKELKYPYGFKCAQAAKHQHFDCVTLGNCYTHTFRDWA